MHVSPQYLIRIRGAMGCFYRALMGASGRNGRQPDGQSGLKIILIALDYGDRQVIERLRNELEAQFHAEVSVSHQEFVPYAFLDFDRNQFNSSAIIEWMEDEPLDCATWQAAEKVLAVTTRDLCIPILTFVFGEARLNGRCAVVSSCRLNNKHYGLPHDPALLSERLLKECVHELGHTFGLIHCQNPKCVMKASTYVEQIDLKSNRFCDRCLDKLPGCNGLRKMSL